MSIQQRFRAVYCATTAEGAFGETVARFRLSITVLASLNAVMDDASSETPWREGSGSAKPEPGVVPADWRMRRVLGETQLDPTLRFLDLAAPNTHQYLRRELAPVIGALGLDDLDLSVMIGPHRVLTQRCARVIHDLDDANGAPMFAGIRYLSRLNPAWECWAVFADHMIRTPSSATTIASDNPDLLQACTLLNLSMEPIVGR